MDLDLTAGVLDLRVEAYLRQRGLSSPLKDKRRVLPRMTRSSVATLM